MYTIKTQKKDILTSLAFAGSIDITQFNKGGNLADFFSFESLVNGRITTLLNFLVAFSGIVAVILLVYAGYNFMMAAGDPDKTASAQKTVTAAIVGMAIVLIARILVEFVLKIILGK